MAITCPTCGYDKNPLDTEFCEACGAELLATNTASPTIVQTSAPSTQSHANELIEIQPPTPQPTFPITPFPNTSTSASIARLISKQAGSPISEFSLDSNNVTVGRFDPDTGPVDVDLEGFRGEETVSRGHAEIYYETQQWKVKDTGSTNGVFIKRLGQTHFGARITIPEILNSGDEIAFGKIRFVFQNP
jgi:pSer/pThr/pTyr-binding forkhead associated (FHA) protein